MQLDPRTVNRRLLLERAGFARPDLSVVLSAAKATPDVLDRLAAVGRNQGLAIQVVRFGASGDMAPMGPSPAPGSSLSLLAVAPRAADSSVATLNRAVAAAIGRVFLVGEASAEAITALVERFSTDPRLGVACIEPSPSCASGLAFRGDVWMALDGLDDAFRSIDWALHDFLVRARTIGFAAPKQIPRLDAPELPIDTGADCRLLRGRARLAPDRSGDRARQPATPVRPDEITVYTAITDRYDTLKPQLPSAVGSAPLVAFLDEATTAQHEGRLRGWQARTTRFPHIGARRASRYFKANAHLALPQARYSLWIDASVSLVAPFDAARLADIFLSGHDICVFRHHARRSIREEAEACKALDLDDPKTIDRQVARYRREGFPDDAGLAELPIILRRHTKAVETLNEAWWSEIAGGSWRDQLSFDYVAWKTGVRYATFPLSLVIPNGLFVKFRR